MAVQVNIVQPAIGTITVVDSRPESYTVRYDPPAGVTVKTGPFRVYCEACGGTLLQSPANPAVFNLADLEEGGHPGPFDISLTTTQTGSMSFSAWSVPAAGGVCTVTPSTWSVPVGDKVTVNIRSTPNPEYQFVGLSYTVYDSDGGFVRERIHFSSSANLNFYTTVVDGYEYVFEAEFKIPTTNMWATVKTGDGTIEPMAQTALPTESTKYWLMTPADGYWCAGMIKPATVGPLSLGYYCGFPLNYTVSVYKGTTAVANWPQEKLGEYPGYFFRNRITFNIVGNGRVDLISHTDAIYNPDGSWCKDATGRNNEGATAFKAVAAPGWVFDHFETPGGVVYQDESVQVAYNQSESTGGSSYTRYNSRVTLRLSIENRGTYDYAIDPQKALDLLGEWKAVFVLNPNGRLLYGAGDHIIYGGAGKPLYSERTI